MTAAVPASAAATAPSAELLAALRDLHLPSDAAPAPLPAGDALLIAAAVLAVAVLAAARRAWRRRPLQQALRALAAAERAGDPAQATRQTSILWRRYAGARYPQAALASADETRWRDFLARCGPAPAADLLDLPYRPRISATDAAAYAAACRRWLRAHAP